MIVAVTPNPCVRLPSCTFQCTQRMYYRQVDGRVTVRSLYTEKHCNCTNMEGEYMEEGVVLHHNGRRVNVTLAPFSLVLGIFYEGVQDVCPVSYMLEEGSAFTAQQGTGWRSCAHSFLTRVPWSVLRAWLECHQVLCVLGSRFMECSLCL